jgi:predicted  nucleic acid-binding Zn-ribbon protein
MTWAETGTIVASILAVGAIIAGRFTDIHKRLDTLENSVTLRLADLTRRVEQLEQRVGRLEERMTRLEERMEAGFKALQAALERVRT